MTVHNVFAFLDNNAYIHCRLHRIRARQRAAAMNFLTNYHLTGMASAFFVTLSLAGLVLQVRFIRERKRRFAGGGLADERPTSTFSLSRFFASYFGFYSLLAYGLCLERLNHYLVWPRALAVMIILVILYAIMVDRKVGRAAGRVRPLRCPAFGGRGPANHEHRRAGLQRRRCPSVGRHSDAAFFARGDSSDR